MRMFTEIIDPNFLKNKLDNLDMSLTGLRDDLRGANTKDFSTLETDVESVLSQLDITLSTLRDALQGTGSKDFTTLELDLESVDSSLDVNLSTRASESSLTSELTRLSKLRGFDSGTSTWQDLQTDGSSRLKTQLDSIPNPSNLDVALSNLDTKLGSLTDALSSVATDKLRVTPIDALPESPFNITKVSGTSLTGRNWSTDFQKMQNLDTQLSTRLADNKIPNALAQINRDISGSTVQALATVNNPAHSVTRDQKYQEISVSTTESSTAFSAPGLFYVMLINRGDNDVLYRINSGTGTQATISPRCGKIIIYSGVTTLYYVTSAGSSTLVVHGFN